MLLLTLGIIIPIGWVIWMGQETEPWLKNGIGNITYEIFGIFLLAIIWPRSSLIKVAIGICLVTCGVEFLQGWQPPFLQALRSTFLGTIILGNHFSWLDFPWYILGSFLAWGSAEWLRRRCTSPSRCTALD